MKRGTIVSYERGAARCPSLLPTFKLDCDYRPVWLRVALRMLGAGGFPVPEASIAGAYRRYSGDFTELGKGEVLVWISP